ncbi:MAG: hypothetical protein PHE67_00295 [Campylobacterales bacterium]|nr:hypothetical protein [Campylobacterales bacterium]
MKTAIMDEAHLLFDNVFGGDNIKEMLRATEGIPNATYKVLSSNRVFVFKKLLSSIKKESIVIDTQEASDSLVSRLEPLAIATPIEAVADWGVIPQFLEVKAADGGFVIFHRYFNSRIPVLFADKNELNTALVTILLGGVIPSQGHKPDFVHNGQEYVFEGSLSIPSTVTRPNINFPLSKGCLTLDVRYVDGFPLINKELYDKAITEATKWKNDLIALKENAGERVGELWAMASDFGFDVLNNSSDRLFDNEDKKFAKQLRKLYPELSMIQDASLKNLYESYYIDDNYCSCDEPYRSNTFIFYLLGRLRSDKNGDAKANGKIIGYSLLDGSTMEDAFVFLDSVLRYDDENSKVFNTIFDIMRFLAAESSFNVDTGAAITTLSDMSRRCRKYGVSSTSFTVVEQQFEENRDNKNA